ncbi:MAG: hypothetical protein N4A45_02280 [Flavobacteriales bacterium]|jgi:UDP-N-acetylmuramyl pentapeptide phosphotransferase/UDP-N-acetylglucosamine-1-phosphate transferase|nr:hypothetical protein [Flavobacteriales bacterium]
MNWKRDQFLFGVLLAVILPLVVFGLLEVFLHLSHKTHTLRQSTKELISLVVVLPIFRYYIVKLKAEKTGRGMMLVIFVYALFFALRETGVL